MTIDFNSFQNNQSISGQTAQSFSSVVKNLSSSVSSGVTGALNSISSKLGITGLSGPGSISGAFGAIGSANIVGELKDTLGVAAPVTGELPQAVASKTAPPTTHTYPADIGKYFMQITFVEESQKNPIVPRTTRPTYTVTLPMPENLQESFNMEYSDKKLGMIGVLMDSMSQSQMADLIGGSDEAARQAASDVTGNVSGKLRSSGAGGAGVAAARYLVKSLSEDASTALDRATGTILNPYQELQFDGISLREHTFSYTFSPNSLAEANTLKEIIKELKIRMHPAKHGLLYTFPDKCKITVSQGLNNRAYLTFLECYLKSMVVNYAPSGTPTFAKGGEHPADISISLVFGEIKPLSRNYYTGEGEGVLSVANPGRSSTDSDFVPSLLKSK